MKNGLPAAALTPRKVLLGVCDHRADPLVRRPPFLKMAKAVSFFNGMDLRGPFYVGPKMEPLLVDEQYEAQEGAWLEGE